MAHRNYGSNSLRKFMKPLNIPDTVRDGKQRVIEDYLISAKHLKVLQCDL